MKNQLHPKMFFRAARGALMIFVAAQGLDIAHGAVGVNGIAQDFTIVNHSTRRPLKLSDYSGTVILLDFWAYWCGPCQASSPDVETNIYQYFQAQGGNRYGVPVTLISISTDDSDPASATSFIQRYGLELVADDFTGVAYQQFGTGTIPHFAVINGVTNSASHQAWQVIYTQAGYSRSSITNAIQIIKGAPASITTQPESRMSKPGSNVTFSVTATGATTYQWRLNGNAIPNATASTFSLSNVITNNSGIYSVAVTNKSGGVISSNAQLLVVPPSSAVTVPRFDAPVFTQHKVTLSFRTAPGYRYEVLYAENIDAETWVTAQTFAPSYSEGMATVAALTVRPQRFYRIRVSDF